MQVGDLVIVKEWNGPGTESNINLIGVITYQISPQEVEIELFVEDEKQSFLEPWIYFKNQLEVLSG